MNNIIKIELPEGTEDEWKEIGGKIVLVEEKKADNPPVTERIKTFDDACNELERMAEKGDDTAANLLSDYESNGNNILVKQTLATMKLSIIAYALNEGWQPQFTKDECRWYPLFTFLTEKELNEMSDEFKSKHNICLFGGESHDDAYCCIVYADLYIEWASSHAHFPFLIAVKSEEIAKFFGNQFIDIWADYITLPSK